MEVNNHVIDVLLDTGSEYSFIKESDTQTDGLTISPLKNISPLQGATGKQLRVLGVTQANLRVGGVILQARMILVPDRYLQPPVLMEMDVLGNLTFTINQRRKVTINGTTYKLRLEEHQMTKIKSVRSEDRA